jgi:hypothetical protein
MEAVQRVPRDNPGDRPETKGEAFERLAMYRVNKALQRIDQVGRLSNRAIYDFTTDDAVAILTTLRQAVDDIESRFRLNSPRPEFRLKR